MIKLGNVFILGDSISTYYGYIPEEQVSFYYDDSRHGTDVNNVNQTWWKKVLDATDSTLVRNDSFTGTTICHTGYSGTDRSDRSFVARLEKLAAEKYFEENKIDTFIIFGGTNDSWANAPLGELQWENWTKEDLYKVLPAFCYLVKRVKELVKGARIVFILNWGLKDEINTNFKYVCEKEQIELIELGEIETQAEGHPTVSGMKKIADEVLSALLNK